VAHWQALPEAASRHRAPDALDGGTNRALPFNRREGVTMNKLQEIAYALQRAEWATDPEELEALRAQIAALSAALADEAEQALPAARFGEVLNATSCSAWVGRLSIELVERQVAAPRSEFHPLLILIRNCATVFRDAVAEDPRRALRGVIKDQLRVGRRLTRRFAARFCYNLEAEFAGTIDPNGAMRLLALASLAFGLEPSVATPAPFDRLLAELDRLGVPDSDGCRPDDGPANPLAAV